MNDETKYFNFQEYSFPNQVNELEEYLISNKIKYNKKKKYLYFHISSALFKYPTKVIAYYLQDKITSIQIICTSVNFSKRKDILNAIEEKYQFLSYNLNESIRVYQAKDYEIKVIGNEKYRIIVEFEATDENTSIYHEPETKKIVLFTLVGIVLSTISILLYLFFKNIIWLNVITLIICVTYAMYQFLHLYIIPSLMDRIYKIALSIIVPSIFVFIALISLVFFIFSVSEPNSVNWSMIGMIFCYLTPSFHLLLLIAYILSFVYGY